MSIFLAITLILICSCVSFLVGALLRVGKKKAGQ